MLGSSAAAVLGLAALAAVLPEVFGERAQRLDVGAVKDEASVPPRDDEPRARQAVEVMAERRPRDVELRLDVADHGAVLGSLNDRSQNRQADGATERRQLLRVLLQ